MAFTETTILSTREPVYGSRRLAQVVALPSGRVDKVSLFLEPKISDATAAESILVKADLYMVDGGHLPTGSPVASDTIPLSDIVSRGFVNFELSSDMPSVGAIVLSVSSGSSDNHVAWRHVETDASGEESLISDDAGSTWALDSGRKFTFIAYSRLPDVVDLDDQSVQIQAGQAAAVSDDTQAEFELTELTRAAVDGDTVVISFGDFVITLVVDQSGSMTWNDREGLRFDFLEQYINDIEGSLPAGSEVTFELVKFHSRKVGALSIILQQEDTGGFLEGVRIVRKTGSAPTSPVDGLVVFEGFASAYLDQNLTSGAQYHYGVYAFDSEGNFSAGRFDYAKPQSPPTPPLGVAGFTAEEQVILSGDDDLGQRKVLVSWVNPQGYDYDNVTVVRRDDRYPESPTDGTAQTFDPSLVTSFLDFDPAADAVAGLTYFYSIFTSTTSGAKTSLANARQAAVRITPVDRFWLLDETPTPPIGFDDTPPAVPTGISVTPGSESLLISWSPGDAGTKRYRIFYKPDSYPRPQTPVNAVADYDGELVFDGTATSFVHRGLSNNEPHFYVIVAMDQAANQSSGVQFRETPSADATDVIPPPQVFGMTAEPVTSTSVLVSWSLDLPDNPLVTAYFGDVVRATANLAFEDADPRETSSTLEFIEVSRSAKIYDADGNVIEDDASTVNLQRVLRFDEAPSDNALSINGNVTTTPFTQLLDPIAELSIRFYASLNIRDRSTGEIITEVVTPERQVTFKNPLFISVINDPPQMVPVRTFVPECTAEDSPHFLESEVNGVFANSGDEYLGLVEVAFRGVPLARDVDLEVRILDKTTGQVSDRLKLKDTSDDGIAILRTSAQEDEVLDRTGEPTGETTTRTLVNFSLPAQASPGEFLVEVTASVLGFSRTVKSSASYVSSLNIDVKPRAFLADGIDAAEQEAFVYFGSYTLPDEAKSPAPDQTIVTWELTKISGGGPKSRPFFSRDSVPGTGIKSYTSGGIARKVFFGPGTDIEPPEIPTCTDGEMYLLKATAAAGGMNAEGFGIIELLPYETSDLKRIFLRLAKDQTDAFGDAFTTNDLARMSIYADGTTEAVFEVVARPEDDIETGVRSGVFFRDSVVGAGGLVPSLPDGTVITLVADASGSQGLTSDLVIKTNLSPSGRRATAKATVVDGKATFTLSANMRVAGPVKEPPLETESSNRFYDVSNLLWVPSPVVFSMRALVTLEVNGQPATFGGGGASLSSDVPPAFVSFIEPLATLDPQ